jgi:SAM-dependent methyltransferase
MSDPLRDRLYGNYVSSGQARPPADLSGLAPRMPYLRHIVSRHFPKDRNANVFEIGCGYGALLHVAREAGYTNVGGVDVSQEQVDAASTLGIAGIAQGDLLPALNALAAESVDVVLAFDVLEHFHRDELVPLVDAVHRVLRPGGRWLIHVPNGESPFVGSIRYGDLTHQLAFTRQSLAQLLLASGFSNVEAHEEAPIVHGPMSALRAGLWAIFRAGMRLYTAAETGETSGHVFTRNLLGVATK